MESEKLKIKSEKWDDRYRSTDNTTTTAYTQHYSYDRLGNIQKLQHIGNNNFTRNFNYTNTNNQLQSIDIGMTNYAFTYDNCGNQIQETTSRHFEWDFGNRLRAFYVQAGVSEPTQYAQYLYDASGTRVKKLVRTQGGNYTSTVYIDDIFEYKTNGTDEQNLLHIMDNASKIAMIRLGNNFGDTTPAIKYNLEDHLGNSTLLLETNGVLINKEEYYPFGETSFGSYTKKRYRYSGKEKDQESGLYYYGARYYGAWTCRFVSVDPLAADYPFYTPYNYAGNKPVNKVDIDGMQEEGAETAPTNGGSGYLSVETSGINPEVHANEDDIFSFTLGEQEFNNISTVEINGEKYFDLGQPMYYVAGEGWSDDSSVTNRMSEYLFTPLSNSTFSSADWVKYNVDLEFGGFEACAAAAAKSCANAGASPLSGWYINQIYMSNGGNLVKSKLPNDESKIIATDLIHISLEAGNPIMVGVDYPNGTNSGGDNYTDHYIVIYDRGYDESGNAYFLFSENVASDATSGMSNNRRLYLQSDGSFMTNNSDVTYNQSQTGGNYTLTGVRLSNYLRNNYKNLINGVNRIKY